MELMIGEKLRKLRRDRDMTQEMLASAFGVSPQAISKWECGDGYPDITMLPMIANYFKVTIDELMGNDEIGQQEDIRLYRNTYQKIYNELEKVEYILGYARKYPKDYKIAQNLTEAITKLPKEKWAEYLPVLRENAEKVINECTIQWIREYAIRDMCLVCPDEELERWEMMCASGYDAVRGEVIEKRYGIQGNPEECRLRRGINNFALLCHFLAENTKNHNRNERNDPKSGVAWQKKQLKILEAIGGGTVPPVWRGRYAESVLQIAWLLFRSDEIEEGYQWFERALELYERWDEHPDGVPLEVGDPELFGGIRGICGPYDDHGFDIVLPDGTYEYFQDAYVYMIYEKRMIGHMPYWRGMENIRETERFQPYIARAKALAGIEE